MRTAKLNMDHVNALDEVINNLPQHKQNRLALEALEMLKGGLCQSENKHRCHGPLWQCGWCGQIYCCVEGKPDDIYCDTCAVAMEKEEKQ